jgi:hypothetical protein
VLGAQQDLWGAVPASAHALGHDRVQGSHQPEVAQLQSAVFVDQQVCGLDVPVHAAPRVQVGQPLQQVVDQQLDVRQRQDLVVDGHPQVRLHVFKHHVQVQLVLRQVDPDQPDYVRVPQLVQKLYLPVSALGVGLVLEGCHHLL